MTDKKELCKIHGQQIEREVGKVLCSAWQIRMLRHVMPCMAGGKVMHVHGGKG
jgi:hypothetical protein